MILGAPCLGALSDRLLRTRKGVVIAGLIGMALTIIILTVIPAGTQPTVLASIFFCFGFFNAAGLLMKPKQKKIEMMPLEMAGVAMTGINFFNMIGPAIFLQGLGSLMQALYPDASRGPEAFNAAFVLCFVCLAIATTLYFFTAEKRLDR